jgi:integrase/recombinase XerD
MQVLFKDSAKVEIMSQEITTYQQGYSMLPLDTTDEKLISMWLCDSAQSTKEAYRIDIGQFFSSVREPIQKIRLDHLQNFKNELEDLGLQPATIARKLKAVKSLLSFAKKTGYTPFNVGVMIKLPKMKEELAERILTEDQVLEMIYLEKQHNQRNYILLRLMYATGARVSEICRLKWGDVHPRGDTGQITLFGKGEKTRHIILKPETYKALTEYRQDASDDEYIFKSRGGGKGHAGSNLDESQVFRIVESTAVRANIATYQTTQKRKGIVTQVIRSRVSPHWWRHAHASHALENGANIVLVKETLGHKSIDTTTKYTHVHPNKSSAQYLKI